MPTENREKLTGPHSGLVGVSSALLLTLLTWAFLFFLHARLWHDPINPLSPNEHSTVIQPAATTPATATAAKPTPH